MTQSTSNNYFSEETFSHLKPQMGLSERYQQRAQDVTLAYKLTHVYGKYHLAMLHRELAMSEERTTYQQAERQAAIMNLMILFHPRRRTFCMEFQELSWMDGSRTPLNGKRLKMYIMSMREVVDAYKKLSHVE